MSIIGVLVSIFLLYRNWFRHLAPLSAGDWSFQFAGEIPQFSLLPSSWMFWLGGGLGGNGVYLLGLETYFLITARLLSVVTQGQWALIERLVWYVPFLILGTVSAVTLVRTVLPKNALWWLAPIIFLTNTYILMIAGGGQMGVAMAYALAPLVVATFVKLPARVKTVVAAALSLAFQMLFDPRIAFITMIAVIILLAILKIGSSRLTSLVSSCGVAVVLAAAVHAFWILPLIVYGTGPFENLGPAYTSTEAAKFFSFADFSHAIVLLHPNWPENLFGKTYFLQPEFLVIPLVAFAALFSRRSAAVAFALVAILGSFLAKGANEPFGSLFLWSFSSLPGFNLFRDPTKFYILTAISYSVLIPIALERAKRVRLPVAIVFLAIWLFTIRQFVMGQLGGTFARHTVGKNYDVLANTFNQPKYFRTFWVPKVQRYALSTYAHPAVDAATLLGSSSPSAVLAWLDSDRGRDQLARWSVRYVVLPEDSLGEIFLDDRTYSEPLRRQYEDGLDGISYFKKLSLPLIDGRIAVYETQRHNDKLWLEGIGNALLFWEMRAPTLYRISLKRVDKPTKLVFSETYDPGWLLRINGAAVNSVKTEDNLNSFPILPIAEVTAALEYAPQQYVWVGLGISVLALGASAVLFFL